MDSRRAVDRSARMRAARRHGRAVGPWAADLAPEIRPGGDASGLSGRREVSARDGHGGHRERKVRVGSTARPERRARPLDASGRSRRDSRRACRRNRGSIHPERLGNVLLLRPGRRPVGPDEQRAPRHPGRRPLVDGAGAAVPGPGAMSVASRARGVRSASTGSPWTMPSPRSAASGLPSISWKRPSGGRGMTRMPRLPVVVLMLLAGAACESPAPPEARVQRGAESPAPSNVTPTVVSPEYRTRQRTIETTGKVQFNEESLARVHAPATGRVLEVFARPGDVVEPGARWFVIDSAAPGQVVAYGQSDTPVNLFVVADLGTMWVVADVYEPDVPRLRRDEPMVATLRCCPGERYEGRVSYISDTVDKETRTVKVRSTVVNRGRTLKAEMFVNVAIATGATR